MVLPDSHGISRAPSYSGTHTTSTPDISVTGLSPSTAGFPKPFTYNHAMYHWPADQKRTRPTTPCPQPLPGITRTWFSHHPLSLATTHGISFPAGPEMFHFPAFPPHALYIQARVTRHDSGQVSPFGHPRIKARLSTPRGLSRTTTSFIGS